MGATTPSASANHADQSAGDLVKSVGTDERYRSWVDNGPSQSICSRHDRLLPGDPKCVYPNPDRSDFDTSSTSLSSRNNATPVPAPHAHQQHKSIKTFETPDDVYWRYFKDRDRRLDGKIREYQQILDGLSSATSSSSKGGDLDGGGGEKLTANGYPKRPRIGPRNWWTKRTEEEILPRMRQELCTDEDVLVGVGGSCTSSTTVGVGDYLNLQNSSELAESASSSRTSSGSSTSSPASSSSPTSSTSSSFSSNLPTSTATTSTSTPSPSSPSSYHALITHTSKPVQKSLPFLRAEELKRLMLLDAHKVRKGETQFQPDLWARFVRRAWELTTGRLYPTNKRVGRRCHVRSVLRFLQAIGSVQYFPSHQMLRTAAASTTVTEPEAELIFLPSSTSTRSSCSRALMNKGKDFCSSESDHESEGSPPGVPRHVTCRMIEDMFLRCMICEQYNRLQQQHYVYLLASLARLRVRKKELLNRILQKMSVCWSLLPQKQLILAANSCARLDLGDCAWAAPLRIALELAIFGDAKEEKIDSSASRGTESPDDEDIVPMLYHDHGDDVNHDEQHQQQLQGQLDHNNEEHQEHQEAFSATAAPWEHKRLLHKRTDNNVYPGGNHQQSRPALGGLWPPEQQGENRPAMHFYDMHDTGHQSSSEEATTSMGFLKKRRLIVERLKAITVLELLPHRVIDVVKLYLQDERRTPRTTSGNASGSCRPNDRSLVLFELYLRVIMQQKVHNHQDQNNSCSSYESELSTAEKRVLEERRDAFYERKGMYEEEQEDADEELGVMDDAEFEPSHEQEHSSTAGGGKLQQAASTWSCPQSARLVLPNCEVFSTTTDVEDSKQHHQLHPRIKAGPFRVDFFCPERGLIVEVLPDHAFFRNSKELTPPVRWRLRFLRGMGFEVHAIPYWKTKSNDM
ncbi:unnamed protein product [Amoebophrya sp. A25]|nr:unnamed protein product [Amoebophrya sp. A25]|eukprot:GSA25T00001638001.1